MLKARADIRLRPITMDKVKAIAMDEQKTPGEVMRYAIESFVKRYRVKS